MTQKANRNYDDEGKSQPLIDDDTQPGSQIPTGNPAQDSGGVDSYRPGSGNRFDGAEPMRQKDGEEGSGSGSGKPRDHNSSEESPGGTPSRESILGQEQAADSSPLTRVPGIEGGLVKSAASLTEKANFASRIIPGMKRRKNKAAATLLAALVIGGGGIATVSIVQGPMRVMSMAQVLLKNETNNENTAAARTQGLWRFYKTGDVGETRVTWRGSKTFAKTTTELKNIGIEFERNRLSGHPTKLIIDPSKYPQIRNLPRAQQGPALDRIYQVDKGTFTRGGGGVLSVDISPTDKTGSKLAGSLTNTSIKQLEDGTIATAKQKRVFKKFFNLPRLFSPLNKLENKLAVSAEARAQRKAADEERRSKMRGPVAQKGAAARANIKSALNGNQGKLSGALLVTAGACLVRSVADSIPAANRAEVLTGVVEETDKVAIAAQAQSGRGLDLFQLGTVSQILDDEQGRGVESARAYQATAGVKNPDGPDITDDQKQAFSNKTTAAEVKSRVDFPGAGAACSPVGQAVQGLVGVGLMFLGPAGWATNALKGGAGMAASAGVVYMLVKQFDKFMNDEDLFPKNFSGPEGGNLYAYTARESANMTARAAGGVELSDTESAAIDKEQIEQSRQEFQSKNFATRMFDIHDHRSLASTIIVNTNTDPGENLNSLASGVTNIGKIIPNLFAVFTPKVSAADEPYDWGFPRYGISKSIINDPKFENPNENANKAAALLNGSGGDDYIEKARKCFGVEISKSSNGWGAIALEDVNPSSEEYISANCNDNNENWKRIILFVFDSRLMAVVACYEDDEEACAELGIGSGGGTETDETNDLETEVSSGVGVDVGKIGTNSNKVACAEGSKSLGAVTTKYTGEYKREEGPLRIRLCEISDIPGEGNDAEGNVTSGGAVVDARLSGVWVAIAKKAKADGITLRSSSSFRLADSCGGNGDGFSCARPGQSFHQTGLAIDFKDMGGFDAKEGARICANRMTFDSKEYKWLRNNTEPFGIKQYVAESWHWDPMQTANRCGKNDGP